ncbi:MAG: cytidylate kinase-like family protein [Candidatus Omnitrophica bacterium]|nr:cytidylate kinase-like family protein [Candidatus Omnitrophota bacterium]
MQIICISRGSHSRGKELAERLAEKLGYACVSREDILEEANREGIPVKDIQAALIKPYSMTESLLLAKEQYLALVTKFLTEQALKNNIVYHGRAGHLLLNGVRHVLRVRVITDLEYRIQAVMLRFNYTREKAKEYIDQMEEERKIWVKNLYNVDWELTENYDMVINLAQMNVENAAVSLCSFSQLPDFQETPASRRVLEDLFLASRARLILAENEDTCKALVKVKATNGVVSVTYQPFQPRVAQYIPSLLNHLEGVKNVFCTMARTNILWIQERFDPSCDTFQQLLNIAEKWDAAIELLRFTPLEEGQNVEIAKDYENSAMSRMDFSEIPLRKEMEKNQINENDLYGTCLEDSGMKETFNDLIRMGRAGGGRCLKATPKQILSGIDKGIDYSLVVVDELFLSKGALARKRLCRELCAYLTERLKCHVVIAEELQLQFLFGKKQMVQMVGYFLFSLFLFALLFMYQAPVLRFMTDDRLIINILSIFALFLFIPLFSFSYGMFSRLLCKWIRLE